MATITATNMLAAAPVTVTWTTLGASDTFTYDSTKRQVLIIDNASGGSVTPLIDGDGATTTVVPGIGTVTLSGGFSLGATADGVTKAVELKDIRSYLAGTIAVTGASGARAALLNW